MNCSFPRAQNVTSFHCAIKNNSDELTNTKTVYPTFDSHVYQFHRNQIQSIWYTRLCKYIRKIYISVYVAFAWHWDNFEPNNDPKNVFICIIPPTHGTGRLTPHHSWSSEKIECPTDDVFPSYYIGVRKKKQFSLSVAWGYPSYPTSVTQKPLWNILRVKKCYQKPTTECVFRALATNSTATITAQRKAFKLDIQSR